ncbi:MAG: hypothetical protein LUC89_03820 [Oscillospiraceae bacterium]|nr:hypothetical protein [Oscillospiraceae bacterium]
MKLEQKRSAWYALAAGAVMAGLGGGLYAGGIGWALTLSFAGLVAAIAALLWAGIITRCPHCGRGLPLFSRPSGDCPYCHRKI